MSAFDLRRYAPLCGLLFLLAGPLTACGTSPTETGGGPPRCPPAGGDPFFPQDCAAAVVRVAIPGYRTIGSTNIHVTMEPVDSTRSVHSPPQTLTEPGELLMEAFRLQEEPGLGDTVTMKIAVRWYDDFCDEALADADSIVTPPLPMVGSGNPLLPDTVRFELQRSAPAPHFC